LLAGSWSAQKTIASDAASKARIENAFRNFKIDVLKKELAQAEGVKNDGSGPIDMWTT
jgi:hypothetical protein